MWTTDPEPSRLIEPSLPLICLVRRHQVSRGCPSPEFDTHAEGLPTHPAGSEWTGRRAQKSFSGATPAGAAVCPENPSPATVPLKRCLVQPQAVTSKRNQVRRPYVATTTHYLLRGGLPRLRAMPPLPA
jgi:hypothetical protein